MTGFFVGVAAGFYLGALYVGLAVRKRTPRLSLDGRIGWPLKRERL
jgi:hypothetical protein